MDKNKKLIFIIGGIIAILVIGIGAVVFANFKGWIDLPFQTPGEKLAEEVAEETIEEGLGGNADVELDEDSMTIETDEGSLESAATDEWPSDIPSDIPEYGDGEITNTLHSESDDGEYWIVAIDDTSDSAIDSYKSLLSDAGFENLGDASFSGARILNMSKGDYSVVISFDSDGSGTIEVVVE